MKFIAKELVDALKAKPMTRFELREQFGKYADKTIDAQVKNGFIGARRITNKNRKVYAKEVLEFFYIKDYFDPRKVGSDTFRNRKTIYLNDKQAERYEALGGYQWLRSYLDESK